MFGADWGDNVPRDWSKTGSDLLNICTTFSLDNETLKFWVST
jgi:hypothetical protein